LRTRKTIVEVYGAEAFGRRLCQSAAILPLAALASMSAACA
jgi:hypothetical protein